MSMGVWVAEDSSRIGGIGGIVGQIFKRREMKWLNKQPQLDLFSGLTLDRK